MGHYATVWAWEQDCDAIAKYVLLCLAGRADGEGLCYQSQERLAFQTGLGIRTIRRKLEELEGVFIQRTSRWRRDGTRTSDAYQLLAPAASLAGSRWVNRPQSPRQPATVAGDLVSDLVRDLKTPPVSPSRGGRGEVKIKTSRNGTSNAAASTQTRTGGGTCSRCWLSPRSCAASARRRCRDRNLGARPSTGSSATTRSRSGSTKARMLDESALRRDRSAVRAVAAQPDCDGRVAGSIRKRAQGLPKSFATGWHERAKLSRRAVALSGYLLCGTRNTAESIRRQSRPFGQPDGATPGSSFDRPAERVPTHSNAHLEGIGQRK